MCNTSLASNRVYTACQQYNLSIVRTINVVPVEGKPPLFTVFVIVLNIWLERCPDIYSALTPCDVPLLMDQHPPGSDPVKSRHLSRVSCSVRGEEVSTLTVRLSSGGHSKEYQGLLQDLGKPSSADRETYDVETILGNNIHSCIKGADVCLLSSSTSNSGII